MPPMEVLAPASPQALNRQYDRTPQKKLSIQKAEPSADDVTIIDETVLREELTRQTTPEKAADKVAEWESARRDAEEAAEEADPAGLEDWYADRRRAKAVAEAILELHSPKARELSEAAPTIAAPAATDTQAPATAAAAPLGESELAAEAQLASMPAPSAPWFPGAADATSCSLVWVLVPLLGVAAAALIAASRRA